MDEVFGETFNPDQGRPGISTRLMVPHRLAVVRSLNHQFCRLGKKGQRLAVSAKDAANRY
jgi:hypothetical protein